MINKFTTSSVLVIFILVVVLTATGCSSRSSPPKGERAYTPTTSSTASVPEPSNGKLQSNSKGGVTIDIEWAKIENDSIIFNVTMDTHSVDLDQYDLRELAILRDDTDTEYRPTSWNSAWGGHHRSGILSFPLPDSLRQGKAEYIEIIIRDIAGIKQRVLKWEL